jgi:hypothetical protein
MLILKQLQQTIQKADMLRKIREGTVPANNKDNQENEACCYIQ